MARPEHHPLRQLEALEETMDMHSGYTGTSRWMIPYADLLTLLLGFLILLFAMSKTTLPTLQKNPPLSTQNTTTTLAPETLVKKLSQHQSATVASTPAKSATVQDLEESLVKNLHLKGHQVTVTQDSRGIVISFQDRLFFDPGEAQLTPQAEKTLAKLSTVLRKISQPIRVEGHTDNTPIQTSSFPSNWELSTARATTILRTLIEKYHLPPQQLSAAGYGEFSPLADNSTIQGKQKNRRVDIVLLNPIAGNIPLAKNKE